MGTEQESQLIARAQKGSVEAFSALVRLHQESAVYTAYSLLQNWEDARDLAQDSFVKAYGSIRSFRQDSSFSTWLYRILANGAKDHWRRKKARHYADRFSTADEKESGVESMPSPHGNPFQQSADREVLQKVQQAMKLLPDQQRTAFGLRYMNGMSLTEIAGVMKLSEGAVKAHLWQAGQKMKKELSEFVLGERRQP